MYGYDYENSIHGLSHFIAPTGRGLFIPESVVDKIEQKYSKRDMEESIAKKLAEEMDRPQHEVLDEQQNVIGEANHNKQQKELEEELKRAGVPHEEVNQQLEEFKRYQETNLQSKENKGTEDKSSSRQPGGDPNNYRQLLQSKSCDYQGRQESRDYQKKLKDLHTVGCYNKHSQPSRSSVMGTSVNKQRQKPAAVTGYGQGQNVAVGSVVKIPHTGGGIGIYGIVRWIGELPNVAGQVAGIELVRVYS